MFVGATLDRRAEAIALLRLLADRAEDASIPLTALGDIAQEIASILKETGGDEPPPRTISRLRVIEGGRR